MDKIPSARSGGEVVETALKIVERLGPYRPEVKSMTVDYVNRTSVLKLLLTIPEGVKRIVRSKIEIPAYNDYSVYEIFEGDSLNRLNLNWRLEDGKWVTNVSKLPKSEKYFVILHGKVSEDALNEIVGVYCPEDPKREQDRDRYWIQSGIKDMSILEKIYSELSIEKVAVDVKVGVERQFATSIPKDMRALLEARARADAAMETADRQELFKGWLRYKSIRRQMGQVTTDQLLQVAKKVLSPELFLLFITIDSPFSLGSVTRNFQPGLIPSNIIVNVHTDLNFQRPAAQGNLTFLKEKFANRLSTEFTEGSQ